jgi:alpha-glucan,water dikinase
VQAPGSSRDLLLLDIALESWLRLLIERQDKRSLSGDDLVELMGLVMGNAALTVSVLEHGLLVSITCCSFRPILGCAFVG